MSLKEGDSRLWKTYFPSSKTIDLWDVVYLYRKASMIGLVTKIDGNTVDVKVFSPVSDNEITIFTLQWVPIRSVYLKRKATFRLN